MNREGEALQELLQLVKDDGHALCFQTFSQYRQVLAGEIRRKLRGLEGAAADPPKQHWYMFAFAWGNRQASRAFGFDTPEITGERLRKVKELTGCPQTAVILGVSQLGFMSLDEMNGDSHEQA